MTNAFKMKKRDSEGVLPFWKSPWLSFKNLLLNVQDWNIVLRIDKRACKFGENVAFVACNYILLQSLFVLLIFFYATATASTWTL